MSSVRAHAGPAGLRPAEQFGRSAVENHLRQPPRRVHGLQRPAREPLAVRRQAEQAELAVRQPRRCDDEAGGHAVQHIALAPRQPPRAAVWRSSHGEGAGVPPGSGLGGGERGDRPAGCDAGQQGLPLGVGSRLGDGGRRQDCRAEKGRGQEGASSLLGGDGEFGNAETGPAIGLGNVDRGDAQILRHRPPDLRVVAGLGFHDPAHLGRWRAVVQEPAEHVAKLGLLLGKAEFHSGSVLVSAAESETAATSASAPSQS